MIDVVIKLRHLPDGAYNDALTLSTVELESNSIVRRGVVIDQVDHGHTLVLDEGLPGESVIHNSHLRPCDVILPGDILLAVEAEEEEAEHEDDPQNEGCTRVAKPAAPGWLESVDTTFEVSCELSSCARHCSRPPLLAFSISLTLSPLSGWKSTSETQEAAIPAQAPPPSGSRRRSGASQQSTRCVAHWHPSHRADADRSWSRRCRGRAGM
eukprot:2529959-Prymnesium_polylepis.1